MGTGIQILNFALHAASYALGFLSMAAVIGSLVAVPWMAFMPLGAGPARLTVR